MELSLSSRLPLLDGHRMPVIGLGVFQKELVRGTTEQAVLWALQHGYRLIDTAALYQNEDEVGLAIKKSGIPREEIFVTTKLHIGSHGKDSTIKDFYESLEKLGLDYIDLYLIHSPKGGRILETWDAIIELQKQRLIRSIGVSNFGVNHLEQLKLARPDAIPVVNQIEVHPYLTRSEVVKYCRQEGIAVEAFCSLLRGKVLREPLLAQIAKKYNKSTAQLLIRWCVQHNYVCIPKSVKEERIIENANVFDFVISEEDMQIMNGLNQNLIISHQNVGDPLVLPWKP